MTNTKLLRDKINESGYKLVFIAEKCGLTYQGLLNKINNKTDFTATEILALKKLLKLTSREVHSIFFGQ